MPPEGTPRWPLKGVEVRFEVFEPCARVELTQVWLHDNPYSLDCLGALPLAPGGEIEGFELRVEHRISVGNPAATPAAVKQFRAVASRGGLAAMLAPVRSDLWEVRLSALGPGMLVLVRLSYWRPLAGSGLFRELRIPVCCPEPTIAGRALRRHPLGAGTVRDTDLVPDASRITPPRMKATDPRAPYLAFRGCLDDPEGQVRCVYSPHHRIVVWDLPGVREVELFPSGAVPDRDILLRWQAGADLRAGWEAPRRRSPMDLYVLLDRSASMRGMNSARSLALLREVALRIPGEDRLWVASFARAAEAWSAGPVPPAVLRGCRQWAELAASTPRGVKDPMPALALAAECARQHSGGRTARVLLITDGQVGHRAAVLDGVGVLGECPMDVVGIDTVAAEGFVAAFSQASHGRGFVTSPLDLSGETLRFLRAMLGEAAPAWTEHPVWVPARGVDDVAWLAVDEGVRTAGRPRAVYQPSMQVLREAGGGYGTRAPDALSCDGVGSESGDAQWLHRDPDERRGERRTPAAGGCFGDD